MQSEDIKEHNIAEDISEHDIERVLSMLNNRTKNLLIQILKNEDCGDELESVFYGVRKQLLVIIKKYKLHFYFVLAYFDTEDEEIKKRIKENLRKIQGPQAFISFLEDGTRFSTEDCRLVDLENLKFFESVEKTRKKEVQKHVFNDKDHSPEDFKKLLGGDISLNYVQRVVSNVAFNSNDNFLLCAPTGVGKTLVSSMRIFRIKEQKGSKMKVAFVAPIKALATEVCGFFERVFRDLVVILATSDVEIDQKELKRANIIVGTPERIELIMRNTQTVFDLIVLDEIHILNDSRGYVVEGIVARAMRTHRTSLIGMSATVYNYEDIGMFLGVAYYNVFYFDESYRPSPLSYELVQTDDLERELDENIVDIELPVVVFVHSQKDTLQTAEHIKQYFERREDFLEKIDCHFQFDSLDIRIKNLIFHQIGIHHSGLNRSTRLIIEEYFKRGIIKVLVSTSTLAWGVNLPIRNVLIKGSTYYNPELGEYVELSSMEIRQMFGRAGRYPNMVGCRGILISSTASNLYFEQTIESHILPNICNMVLAELFLGINNFKDLMEWFSNTFYVVRLVKYNQDGFQLCKDILYTALHILKDKKMIEGFNLTYCGKLAVKYFVDYRDLLYSTAESSILDIIGQVREFRNLKGNICSSNRSNFCSNNFGSNNFDSNNYRTKFNYLPCKTNFGMLFQFYINGEKTEDEIVNQSILQIVQNFPRIANCFFDLFLENGTFLQLFELIKAFDRNLIVGQCPLRYLDIDLKIVEETEKKKIPYKVLRRLKESECKELGVEIFPYLKFLPSFEVDLQIFCEQKDRLILIFEIEKAFNDSKMDSIKYLFVIRDFYNSILLSDVVYFYKNVEHVSLVYTIPKRRYIQVEIGSFWMINCTVAKAFDLRTKKAIYQIYSTTELESNSFNLILNSGSNNLENNKLKIFDQFKFEQTNYTIIVKDEEMKYKTKGDSITHWEFLEKGLEGGEKKYILLNTHEISESPFYWEIIKICKEKEIELIPVGFPPRTKIDPNSLLVSKFNKYWDRTIDFLRSLTKAVEQALDSSHLIVVSNNNAIEIIQGSLEDYKAVYFRIVFFKDVDFNSKYDFVHIFDTQYFDYSTSTLVDYKLFLLCHLSRLGRYQRFYIKSNKVGLYFDGDYLQVLYKYSIEDENFIVNENLKREVKFLQRDKNFLQNENLQRDKNFLQNENLQRSEKFL
ncbi:Activating signal cointegrator 1 complex subunit 3-like, partial [Nosema granulosis]